MAKIDTNSGLYALAQNSRTVGGKDPIVVTKPTTTNKYAAVLQEQAAAGTATPSVAGETATAAAKRQAQVNSYAQVLKNQTATKSVAGETAGAEIQKNPVVPQTEPVVQPTTQQKVSYIDGNGDKQIGYAEVVAQPEAPAAETQAENTVDYWSTMKDMYTRLYDEAVAANDAQAALAAERAAAAADEQLAALAAEYEGTNRQLYRDYMQTQRVLPQQLAAQGYTGGLTESARLRLGISYQDALARNEQARIAAAAGIGNERAQTKYEIAAAAAEANRQALANQNAQMIALEQERYQYDQALKEARVQQMAAAGDFTGMLDLGYSQDEVDYLTRVWLLENPNVLSTWIAAHPVDAERLGLTTKTTTAVYTPVQKTPAQLIADNQQARDYGEILRVQAAANDMVRDGAAPQEVKRQLEEGVKTGTISYAAASAANAAITNPLAGLPTSELNAIKRAQK